MEPKNTCNSIATNCFVAVIVLCRYIIFIEAAGAQQPRTYASSPATRTLPLAKALFTTGSFYYKPEVSIDNSVACSS
jgi:hypothetical protein